jgi:branched-subunit amino acid transport protein AzlD
MLSLYDAVLWTFAMALVIFACRALPFIAFKRHLSPNAGTVNAGGFTGKFIAFVERTAPPVTMAVLTFNAISVELLSIIRAVPSPAIIPANLALEKFAPPLAASALTAILHVWKRNALLSIGGATILYIVLRYIVER